MNLDRIITEAINRSVLLQLSNQAVSYMNSLRNVQLNGPIYNFASNLNQYCNDINQAITQNRIEPNNQNAQTSKGNGVIDRQINKRYYDPRINIYNNLRGIGLELPMLNGVWDSSVRSYNKTKDFLGMNQQPSSGKVRRPTTSNSTRTAKELILQKDNYKNEYSRIAQTVSGTQIDNTVNNVFRILDRLAIELNR